MPWPKSEKIRDMEHALGQQLRALRHRAGWTQYHLADDAGYSRAAISLAEIGRQFPPRDFWVQCDAALHANGVLAAGYSKPGRLSSAQQPWRLRTPPRCGHCR